MGRFVVEQLTFKRKNRKKKTHHVKVENEKQKAITPNIEVQGRNEDFVT